MQSVLEVAGHLIEPDAPEAQGCFPLMPGSATITIGCSRLRSVPAHVAYCPPSPMLMLPARCAAANSAGSRVSSTCAPTACSDSR